MPYWNMSDCSTMSVGDLADSDHDSLKENRPYQKKKVKACVFFSFAVCSWCRCAVFIFLYKQLWIYAIKWIIVEVWSKCAFRYKKKTIATCVWSYAMSHCHFLSIGEPDLKLISSLVSLFDTVVFIAWSGNYLEQEKSSELF